MSIFCNIFFYILYLVSEDGLINLVNSDIGIIYKKFFFLCVWLFLGIGYYCFCKKLFL